MYVNIKADMKKYIHVYTTADGIHIFFLSNLYVKQGIGSVYVMFDFKGYLELSGTRVEPELQNEKILTLHGVRTRDLPLPKRRRYH